MLDLTKTWTEIGSFAAQKLGLFIKQHRGIDGLPYSPLAPSTLKARLKTLKSTTGRGKARKGPQKSIPSSMRLYATGDLADRGFSFTAAPDRVTVFATDVPHTPFYGSNPLLSDIVRWNSRGQAEVNQHITNPPLVFPTNPSEIQEFNNITGGQMWKLFVLGVNEQLAAQSTLDVKANLKLG